MDNAPSIPEMKREIQEARIQLERRRPPATSYDLVDMLDSKLTNFISDLRKDDPKYKKKVNYFEELLISGMLRNAAETFERKGHGKVEIPGHRLEQAIAASQAYQGRVLPPYVSNGGKKKKTLKRRHRRTLRR
jgi:hypothetical protein